MKSKVMLFDASGAPVGETFMRRARQLVSQQRAEWINDGAIRFAPDADISDIGVGMSIDEETLPEARPIRSKTGPDALLYHIAETRLQERKNFIWHSILLVPVTIICLILGLSSRSDEFLTFLLGAWLSPYGFHAFIFFRKILNEYRPESRARQIEGEVEKLRRTMEV